MPANDGRHHHITHRAYVGTLSACAAAIIALTLGPCSSTTTTPATSTGATAIPSPSFRDKLIFGLFSLVSRCARRGLAYYPCQRLGA